MTDHNLLPEIGKRYVRRDGSVTPVLTESDEPLFKLFNAAYDPESDMVYQTEGDGSTEWRRNPASRRDDDLDLMEEYTDE